MREPITFIIPNRNNWKYLNLCYKSIKKYAPNDYIIILDDASLDSSLGTYELIKTLQSDKLVNLQFYSKSESDLSPFGHTILYNKGVELANTSIICILHADMIISENFIENLIKHLTPKTIVSATRIEPPLHPAGKEKLIQDFGIYPEDFKEKEFHAYVKNAQEIYPDLTTQGFFAPWIMYKDEYIQMQGMDSLFQPYPHEDVDWINRLALNKFNIIQSWDSLCWHFTNRNYK